MSFPRRTFLAGAATGLSVLVLSACTPTRPQPSPSTTPAPAPTVPGVPEPVRFARSSWSADQFARGAHSYVAVGSSVEQRAVLRTPLGNRVFFAGEATEDEQPSTVAGALASGIRAAFEVQDAAEAGERVIIVGAGIAGAAAARRLADLGHEIIVLEARDRTGGRIDTRRNEDWPIPVELGAGAVRGTDVDTLTARLSASDVFLSASGDPILVSGVTGAEVDPSDDPAKAVAAALAWAVDQPRDTSLADALDGSGAGDVGDSGDPSPAGRLAAYLRDTLGLTAGAAATAISSWYTEEPVAGFPAPLVLGGFDQIVTDALADLDVRLSSPVTAVGHTDDGVSLRLPTGEAVSGDRVIVTVPLGVLKEQGIVFDPALPFAQRAAIDELGVGTSDTVWLLFDEPFWDTDAVVVQIVGGDGIIADWVNLEPLTGAPLLVGHVVADQADAFAALDDDAARAAALASLTPLLPTG